MQINCPYDRISSQPYAAVDPRAARRIAADDCAVVVGRKLASGNTHLCPMLIECPSKHRMKNLTNQLVLGTFTCPRADVEMVLRDQNPSDIRSSAPTP